MVINKDSNGRSIGFVETLVSNERVVTINQARQVTTITSRDRTSGKVQTETFFGAVPLTPRDR